MAGSTRSTLTGLQAKKMLEGVGLDTQGKRCRLLGVWERTVRRWEHEDRQLPQTAANLVYLAARYPVPEGYSILELIPIGPRLKG